jgi:hypothetical protein
MLHSCTAHWRVAIFRFVPAKMNHYFADAKDEVVVCEHDLAAAVKAAMEKVEGSLDEVRIWDTEG